jgi:hypothetical protein
VVKGIEEEEGSWVEGLEPLRRRTLRPKEPEMVEVKQRKSWFLI